MNATALKNLKERLRQRPRLEVTLDGFARAAVLVPIVVDDNSEKILFIVRRGDLARHPGQIAFPGGRAEPADATLEDTALRETDEELGIAPAQVEVLGRLDDCPTPTQFIITPIVGLLRAPLALRPDGAEIADSFYADLHTLAEASNYSTDGERSFLGVTYVMHEYRYGEHRIWGATARILHQLLSSF
jgi:8-oxo-dGTP pyrophosphatase MutT (NUDIX family)